MKIRYFFYSLLILLIGGLPALLFILIPLPYYNTGDWAMSIGYTCVLLALSWAFVDRIEKLVQGIKRDKEIKKQGYVTRRGYVKDMDTTHFNH